MIHQTWRYKFKSTAAKLIPQMMDYGDNSPDILNLGHRDYVGGLYEQIGTLQFEFLLNHGLKPYHFFLDIACGSLRLGRLLIPYLESEHYYGIDKEPKLIEAGLNYEVTDELIKLKKPYFVVSYDFEFERFPEKVDLAIAHSLFTHLPPRLIHKCLKNFLVKAKGQTILFATFFETNKTVKNPPKPGDHKSFLYTREEMVYFGEANGYSSQYIGQWGHPRGQVMVAYSPR